MPDPIPPAIAEALIAAGQRMDHFGWVPATAGNLSIRLGPDRIAITRSGGHKGFLDPSLLMVVDLDGKPEQPGLRPSAETGLHCGIYRRFPETGAVLHGHSQPGTVLSRQVQAQQGPLGALKLAGYELLKAFPGLPTHEAEISLPIVANDQDIPRLQKVVDSVWNAAPDAPPGYLIAGHGGYVWGKDMPTALLRLEALEFMLACELEERRLSA